MDYKEKIQKLVNGEMIDGIRASEIQIGVLKALFPEFTESEDEKVRKDVISYVQQALDSGYGIIDKDRKEKWIAWLEKQSSLNTNQNCLKGIKRVQECQDLSNWEKEFDNIASMYAYNKNQEGYNDSCYVKERAAEMLYHAKKELEKQGEQTAKTCRDAWSEEDSSQLDAAINIVANSGHTCTSDWLKSLKDRVQPQPKQECSEEDEKIRQDTIRVLEEGRDKYIRNSGCFPSWSKSISWLKSLRPQNTWKPSLSQLNALGVVAKGNAPDDIEEINSLYNDLKKL